jgi:hypothetical protein
MGEQSATRLGGDDYQHLYSWYEILPLLDDDSAYDYAYIEHPEAGAADDLTLHPKAGTDPPTRFMQIKWHVDQRSHYTFDALVAAGADSPRSLLQKLFDSWRKLRDHGPLEVWLVSNWSPAPHPDLGGYLGDRAACLSEDFFTGGPRSRMARVRTQWMAALEATTEEAEAFCRALRFELAAAPIHRLFERVDDRMAKYGLKHGENARAVAVDEIRRRIQDGGDAKRITRNVLRSIIQNRGLRADVPDAPETRLWIHAWDQQGYDVPPTVELDWTRYFDREERRVPAAEEWRQVLMPRLQEVRKQFAARPQGKYIDLRGKMSLTAGLAVGAAFPRVAGFSFRIEQPTGGDIHLWRSDAPASDARFVAVAESGAPGDELAVGLSVTGRGLPDLERFVAACGIPSFVYAEPEGGTGHAAIPSAGDAAGLALSAKELIREARERYRATRVHLFLYSPISFAVFLGQAMNALGPVVTYERTADGGYQESVTLRTG